ncbi:MAG: tyrosine-type recombinase/integrase [Planctomycetota bacterium]|jgi:integrase
MSQKSSLKNPSYRCHKATGQAVVTLKGKDIYLGKYGTKASQSEYDRLISEWLANGRQLPATANGNMDITINELIARYWKHAKIYYVKNGRPTREQANINLAMRPLRRLYGRISVTEFGPLALKAVRQSFIDDDHARTYINDNIGRIKRMFKWGVENELVPPSVYHGLQSVSGLRRGRSEARETEPVKPVPDEFVDAIKPFVSRQVWAMIELQRITGMRPGEVTMIRGCDIDISGKLWEYRPAEHKTEHHGRQRVIMLGPRAQAVIREFLKPDLQEYLFSPMDAEKERHAEQRHKRKTKVQPSQIKRAERSKRRAKRGQRKRAPKDYYTTVSYRRAIARACDEADKQARANKKKKDDKRIIPNWHPNQLRHNCATRLRKEYGIEVARVVLGHSSALVTEIYAEIDTQKAADIMAKVG